MKNWLKIILVISTIWGCGNPKNEKAAETPVEVVQEKDLELPDSLFKLKNQLVTFKVQNYDFEEEFVVMDSIQKMKLLGKIAPFNEKDKSYVGYFVSLQNKIGHIRPIIVYGETENYSALILLNLDENNKVISSKEIAGGFCDAPVHYDDRIQWCDDKLSTIVNDSMLVLFHLHLHSPSYERVNEKFIDSVKYLFRINPDGKFEQVKRDSTRYFRIERK